LKRRADAPRAKPSTKPEHRRVTIAVPLQELPPPMFEASGVCKRFGSGAVTSNAHEFAVDEVSFTVRPGEVFAVVGESGAGKSTLARIITGLTAPTFGSLRIDGRELAPQRPQTDRRLIQLVGQNPRTALNRRYRVRHALEQPLKVHGIAATSREREQLIMHGIERVGLSASHLSRRPSDLSGGELARVVLVRALLARPRMLVLDEPTSNLDATTKLTIQELLADLCAADHLSVILITHEIDVARRLSDRAAVMLAGQLVEVGPSEQVLHCPVHPYARSLLASVLTVDPASRTLALPAAAAGVDP
jgi:ABC-type glutathione transport system ATPase component